MNKLKSVTTERWQDIDWKETENHVFKLQQKIFNACKNSNITQVRKYQKVVLHSYHAKLLAVRRVTQDNTGKTTAGIDGIKTLPPQERLKLAKNLVIPSTPSPSRRVWIPKKGTNEKRPLGIPTIKDRALQALIKILLEPEWEAKFENGSYGFRPGRSAHDAISDIRNHINKKAKFVLDADLTKCFDRINHDYLLNKLNFQKGRIHNQIKLWLKAGIVDKNVFEKTDVGTPQGGVISPLLANIALHGMETHLKEFISDKFEMRYPNGKKYTKERAKNSLGVIRYADDFVIIHEDYKIISEIKDEITEYLKPIGLELNLNKTAIKCTLKSTQHSDIKAGFNFLGFTFKSLASNHRSALSTQGKKLGFKTLIYPSTETVSSYRRKLHNEVLVRGRSLTQETLIMKLNSIVSGWSRYFGVSDANTMGILSSMDYNLYLMLRKWAKRSKRSSKKARSLWRKDGRKNWIFSSEGKDLYSHTKFSLPLIKYIKVKSDSSPYSHEKVYWSKRIRTSVDIKSEKAILLSKQKDKCAYCENTFKVNDILETDHIIPLNSQGKDILKNKQLLHRHCHHKKTREDATLVKK